jgi:uncharacterized membrane protein YgaE (UPF0421/DUF939 family)
MRRNDVTAWPESGGLPRPRWWRPLANQLPPRPRRRDLQLAAKMAAAGTLAWWICTLLGADRPLFAVLVPLVAMGGDALSSINVSVSRTFGVFAGVGLGLALLQLDLPSTALVAVLLTLSLLTGLVLRAHSSALNNQIAITAMFMLYVGVARHAETVGVARIWETAVGAGVAVAVAAFVWPPDPLREARHRVGRLRGWLAQDLRRVTELLDRPDVDASEEHLELVRERSQAAVTDVLRLEQGARALRWNPRRRTDAVAFADERHRLTSAARQYRHLRTIARIVADTAAEPPLPPDELRRITETLSMLTAAADDSRIQPPPVDPASLHDPRAIGLALKLRQMIDDLSAA